MSFFNFKTHLLQKPTTLLIVSALFAFLIPSFGLTTDGILLLSFKYSVISDPLFSLQTWNYNDDTPCSWHGVTCSGDGSFRVVVLSLPDSQLLGSIPADLGMLQCLKRLDLSNNSLNGSLPESIFALSELRFLDLSNNMISGEIPPSVALSTSLQFLNLSDNALAGKLPANLTVLDNLIVVSLKNNYLSGELLRGFGSVEVLDLSSNLINGSLPPDFGGDNIKYLNISYNRISGEIPPEFMEFIPKNAKLDLSYNNLTGQIPDSGLFKNQEFHSFDGNPNLCGHPTRNPCPVRPPPPSPTPPTPLTPPTPPTLSPPTLSPPTLSPTTPPANGSSPNSPPAIAAIPKTIGSNAASDPASANRSKNNTHARLKPLVIIAIIVGDFIGIGLLAMVVFFVYKSKRKQTVKNALRKEANEAKDTAASSSSSEARGFSKWSCLRKRVDEEVSESESESEEEKNQTEKYQHDQQHQKPRDNGTLLTFDGDEELEIETLLKASAYILGASGSSIMYKAVLEDGTALAVRRIGESYADRFRNFETQVRVIAKLVHPNLVRIRGFYWGVDEKLIIYDFVPNGSLANARHRKVGSSPCHLSWDARLRIAKGVARGLLYLHEKKHVHGNLKPSNILLGLDMEPKIGDFGLDKLLTGETSYKAGGSSRIFGSKRSTISRDSFHDIVPGPSPSPSPSPSSVGCVSPYHAPECLRNLKPNPKWDMYSFGVILLELLTGKIIVVDELGQGNGLVIEDKFRALRMADVAIRADLEGKEEALLACFKIGYSCASPVPQKRPTMKEVIQALEKFPVSSPILSFY